MMQFVGLTAAIDAVLVLLTWGVLSQRHASGDEATNVRVKHFLRYLALTFVFLLLIAVAMLGLAGQTQAVAVMVADVILWVALAQLVLLATAGGSASVSRGLLVVLYVLGFSRTAFQLAGLAGVTPRLPAALTWLLGNMDVILMYAVWVPVAVMFLTTAARATTPALRARSVMFALGLLLTTYSWVARLQLGYTSLLVVGAISVVGFGLLLGGVLYRAAPAAPPAPTPLPA